jgi:hypothetical protein
VETDEGAFTQFDLYQAEGRDASPSTYCLLPSSRSTGWRSVTASQGRSLGGCRRRGVSSSASTSSIRLSSAPDAAPSIARVGERRYRSERAWGMTANSSTKFRQSHYRRNAFWRSLPPRPSSLAKPIGVTRGGVEFSVQVDLTEVHSAKRRGKNPVAYVRSWQR